MLENKKMEELGQEEQTLIKKALEAQKESYCPYSNYPVGAAVLSENGNIYIGWNAETVSFNQSVHAEQSAIMRMPKKDRKIKMLAFVSRDGGAPCGHCRQIISEFGNPNTKILGLTTKDNSVTITTLEEILPLPMPTGKGAL
ncbi:cytidine deaminase [Candidatus Parcubacteria bacterium]|nr:cytidine deaminase [Patescibacteria group bacterium]MCG2694234.1 cytidine deaminase [Candidatus Parcubacteria bacterium]